MTNRYLLPGRPSSWWPVLGALCALLAVGFIVAAVVLQREASAPIGEGELFAEDARAAAQVVESAGEPGTAVREVRNQLEIEAVSLTSSDRVISASTSPNLVGRIISNEFLGFSISQGRFAAAATPIESPVLLDGVREWETGDVLYQVAYPLSSGESILLYYDISQLFNRRAGSSGIQSETLQLLGLGVVFIVLATAIAIGHLRAKRRHEVMERESELLRSHAAELAEANVELEKAKREAERALELAEEKIRIRSEFVLMINHELRTPLTSLITGATLLRDGDLDGEEQRQLLEAMVRDGTRLQEIIDQILAVARIENRGLSYELSEGTTMDLEDALAQADAHLKGDPGPGDARVITDLSAVGLVVSSLADNARTHGADRVVVDYGLESDIEPMVEVGKRPEPAIHIRVADNGPGIDPDFLPRAFEKFEKSSFSSGTGLGLYMARTIVEALDGSIAVATSPQGTVFEIALPCVRTPAAVAG